MLTELSDQDRVTSLSADHCRRQCRESLQTSPVIAASDLAVDETSLGGQPG